MYPRMMRFVAHGGGQGTGSPLARFQHQGQPNTSPANHSHTGPQPLQVARLV